jgi:flagellar hook-length control protein FliK
LAKLATPDPAILGDEPLGPDLGAPPGSQSSVTTTAAATTALPRSYAPHVAHQIVTAIVQTSGATTEIALNPEELGRVRISVTAGDNGLTVAIIAERPETVDLMRRNIDLLTRELREMGYENPTFTFGDQSGDADQDQGDGAVQSGAASDPSTADEHPQTSMRVALSGGLDLKL